MRNIEDIQENFRRGVIDLAILLLLREGDKYPYQINQEIEARTNGKLQFFVGSMYGPLRRMMENGEISERKEIVGERRFRNYYHLEDKGLTYLHLLLREYENMSNGIALLVEKRKDTV